MGQPNCNMDESPSIFNHGWHIGERRPAASVRNREGAGNPPHQMDERSKKHHPFVPQQAHKFIYIFHLPVDATMHMHSTECLRSMKPRRWTKRMYHPPPTILHPTHVGMSFEVHSSIGERRPKTNLEDEEEEEEDDDEGEGAAQIALAMAAPVAQPSLC